LNVARTPDVIEQSIKGGYRRGPARCHTAALDTLSMVFCELPNFAILNTHIAQVRGAGGRCVLS
jgi:hypothetical protein